MKSKTLWAAGIAATIMVGAAQAATSYNWNITNGGNWSVAGNWTNGTIAAGKAFALRNIGWLATQLQQLAAQPKTPVVWQPGT